MPELRPIRTSLEVGFSEAKPLPDRLLHLRGRDSRSIPLSAEYPFEDAQFDVVLLEASVVSPDAVREAHRVLRANGTLNFIVPERTKGQDGFTLPEIYSILRSGFNIVGLTHSPWWRFGVGGRWLTIRAEKKNWKSLSNTYRPYVV